MKDGAFWSKRRNDRDWGKDLGGQEFLDWDFLV
jgi:hypothetical protein